MKELVAILLILAAAVGALAWLQREDGKNHPRLMVYCAAGLKKPVEEIAAQFRHESDAEVQLQFGGTGSLLSAIRTTKSGDLFIAADTSAIADGQRYGIFTKVIPVISQHPVIAVKAGNPKAIQALHDLLRDDVRVALANPESAAIGRTTQRVVGARWEQLREHATVLKPTVMDITGDLALGAVDAAVVWDALAKQFKGIEAVDAPEFAGIRENASAAILGSCKQPELALKFARYLATPETGGAIFRAQGYTPIADDR